MTSVAGQAHETAWRRTGIVVFIVAVRRHPTRVFRSVGTVIAGLTAAEFAWAAAYVAAGEAKPWIWLIPCVAAVGALVAFIAAPRDWRLPSQVPQ